MGDGLASPERLPETVRTGRPPGALLSKADRKVRAQLIVALRKNNGNVSAAARILHKDRKQIQRWVRRFGLGPAGYREEPEPEGLAHAERLPETVHTGRLPGALLSKADRKVRAQLIVVLRKNRGNVSAAARILHKDRKQIQRWVKRFGLGPADYRKESEPPITAEERRPAITPEQLDAMTEHVMRGVLAQLEEARGEGPSRPHGKPRRKPPYPATHDSTTSAPPLRIAGGMTVCRRRRRHVCDEPRRQLALLGTSVTSPQTSSIP